MSDVAPLQAAPNVFVISAPEPTFLRAIFLSVTPVAQQPASEFNLQEARPAVQQAAASIRLEAGASRLEPMTLTFTPAAIGLFRETFDRYAGPTVERRVALQAYLLDRVCVEVRKLVSGKEVRAVAQSYEDAPGDSAASGRRSWTAAGDLATLFSALLEPADDDLFEPRTQSMLAIEAPLVRHLLTDVPAPRTQNTLAIEAPPVRHLLTDVPAPRAQTTLAIEAPPVRYPLTASPPLRWAPPFDVQAWTESPRHFLLGPERRTLSFTSWPGQPNRLRQRIMTSLVARSLHTRRIGETPAHDVRD